MSLKTIEAYTIATYNKYGAKTSYDLGAMNNGILRLMDHGGKILDMGCGCGWLLQYIVDGSVYPLIPHGVDLSKEAIQEAKTKVFPQYAENFVVEDVAEVYMSPETFDYIIANPLYFGEGFAEHYENMWDMIAPGGKLIIKIPNDALEQMALWWNMWQFLNEKNIVWVQTNMLTLTVPNSELCTASTRHNAPLKASGPCRPV